jgi:cell division protein FtsW
MNFRKGSMDWPLFGAIMLMLGFGIVLVYSSSFALAQHKYGGADFFLTRQSLRAVLAIACFMIFINVDYHRWGRWSGIAYLLAIALLIAIFFLPSSHAVNGARRWLSLGPIRFQVSDFARLALVVFLARKCDEAGEDLKTVRGFVNLMIITGVICGLILIEPNFSTAAILGVVALAMMFLSGARFWHLAVLALSAIPVAAIMVWKTPYMWKRILGFLSMDSRRDDIGYQTFQSLVGLGNGGLFGVGIGKGEQKYFYLPEPHTDFIFSILGEEIGFVGLIAVLAVLGFIVYRGMRIALNAPDRMGKTMAFGFTFAVGLCAIINASVAAGLVPTTGQPMPFLSYGGMSLVFTMCSMGIVLNISNSSLPRMRNNEGKRL